MAHVVLVGPVRAEDLHLGHAPLELTEGAYVFKTFESYLSRDKRELLVRALIVDRGYARKFFLSLRETESDRLTIGTEPLTDPEKTNAVRRMIAIVAERILLAVPECRLEQNTLGEGFLKLPQ